MAENTSPACTLWVKGVGVKVGAAGDGVKTGGRGVALGVAVW